MNGRLLSLLGLNLALLLGGCETDPATAFPTVQRLAAVGSDRDAAVATLARGRKIFTTTCTECHVARPVASLSVSQWKKTITIMAPRAHLTISDRAAVAAYVTAARAALLDDEGD